MIDTGAIDVFPGLDVGKGEHHATAITPAGKKAFDKRLLHTEPKLRELFAKPQAKHGTVLVVVDQPASIGALPLAVPQDMGCPVAYLPGLTMRRIADLYPGEAKTDAKDAFIIADAARAMPHTLRAIDGKDETIAEMEMIVGFNDDLAGEATKVANRLHGLLTQVHPSLERVLGPRLQHPGVLTLLERFGSPAQIRKAGRRRLVTLLRLKAPRMAERLVEEIFAALDEQTVTVPGTEAAALIVPSLATSLTAVLDQRKLLAGRIEKLLENRPASVVMVEPRARNTGENIRFSRELLAEAGVEVSSVLLISKPHEERRSYATARKLWPEVEIVSASSPMTFRDYINSLEDARLVIDMLVGALQRLLVYTEQGYMISQQDPGDVLDAYDRLSQGGYISRLLRDDEGGVLKPTI